MSKQVKEVNPAPKYPMDALDTGTRKFKPREIVYQDRGFVMAVGAWDEYPNLKPPHSSEVNAVAMRWHTPGKLGYPNGFGKPQWMKAPFDIAAIESMKSPMLPSAIRINLLGNPHTTFAGAWALHKDRWLLVVNQREEGNVLVDVCGDGDDHVFTVAAAHITKLAYGPSIMEMWFSNRMNNDPTLWLSPEGRVYVSFRNDPDGFVEDGISKNLYVKHELIYSPLSKRWSLGGRLPAMFDYMFEEHALLHQIPKESVTMTTVSGHTEMYITSLITQAVTYLESVDLSKIYDAYASDRLHAYVRMFDRDLTEAELSDVFAIDMTFGTGSYYNLLDYPPAVQ